MNFTSTGHKMVADGLCSYNIMSTAAVSQPLQMLHSSHSQPLFTSSPLSLALPKMENLGEMAILGESYDRVGRTREDEVESRSGSDNFEGAASGDDDNSNTTQNKSSKRKKYHRHTAFQIQELEACFKDNPHPDEKARLELGKRLGLEGRQVKFWFQNRRTQMKTQLERHENSILKQENDKLRIDNIAMKDAMRNPMCESCGSPAILGEIPIEQHHLMIENARLKDELNRLRMLAGKFLGGSNTCNSKLDLSVGGFCGFNSQDFGIRAPFDKSLFLELALAGMDELIKLAQLDTPFWFRSSQGNGEFLNLEEYSKMFSPCLGLKPSHLVTEATRATGNVIISSMALVETLMDVKQWTEIFPWNIGSASTLDVISPGTAGGRNGALQLMQAEFQVPSPVVPVRQMKFIRYCKQHGDDTWAVVDVSVDTLFHGNMPVNCRRLPSGCIVRDMPNGYSKVTWIEHSEYNEEIVHRLYRPLLKSGMGLGAQKWVANLQRQCELRAVVTGDHSAALPASGTKSLTKLAQRMSRSFCTGVCSTVHKWEGVPVPVQVADNTKLMMRKSIGNCGEPPGVILSATTTVWMGVSPHHLLDFLQDDKMRSHWDVLSQDGPMQLMLRFPNAAQDTGNTISIVGSGGNVLILQQTCSDASGSLVVHTSVGSAEMNVVMSGADSSAVPILPTGFAIMPDCFPESSSSGSLLTLGFQILVSNLPAADLTVESVDTVNNLIARTLQGIKAGLHCD